MDDADEKTVMRKEYRFLTFLALIAYIGFIFCSTVFFREIQQNCKYNLHPFWSYNAILNGRDDLVTENIMNIVMFMPVGFLLRMAFVEIKWRAVLLIGLSLSIGIEMLQFVYSKGFTEFDDVMHNTLGCMIGYGVYALVKYSYEWNYKRSVGVR